MIITGKMLSIGGTGAGNGGSSGVDGDAISKTLNGADISDKAKFRRNIGVDGLTLSGPGMVYPGVMHEYTITGWSDFSAYEASASHGTASVKNGVVALNVPVDVTGTITLTITRNDAQYGFTLEVSPVFIRPPQITFPADGATDIDFDVTMAASDFACNKEGADTYLKTQWEISTGSGYYTDEEIAQAEFNGKPLQEYNVVDVRDSSLAQLNIVAPVLLSQASKEIEDYTQGWITAFKPQGEKSYQVRRGATYRVRARHAGHNLTSGWSDYVTFTISDEPIARPVIMSPASGETGVDSTQALRASDFLLQHHAVDELKKSEWEIAADPAFTDIIWKETAAGSMVTPPGNILKRSSVYYLRMRYEGRDMGYSDYSDTANFTTAAHFLPTKEIATLLQPDGVVYAYFNAPAFSHDGEWLFVGARGVNISAGAVYTYKREGQAWKLAQIIKAPVPDSYTFFGSALAFAGNSLFVASGIYMYECTLQGDKWSPLPAEMTRERRQYGSDDICVSQDGNTAAIQKNDGLSYSVKVLTREAGTGAWTGVLAGIPERNLEFGKSLSLSADGTVLAVGAPRLYNSPSIMKDSVYIFRLTAGAWKLEQTLRKSDNIPEDFYRVQVSPDASLLFIGGRKPNQESSAIHAFHYRNGEWQATDAATLKGGMVELKYTGGMLVCESWDYGKKNIEVAFYDTTDGHLKLKAFATKESDYSSNPQCSLAVSDDRSTMALGVYDNTQGDNSNAVVIFTEGGATE